MASVFGEVENSKNMEKKIKHLMLIKITGPPGEQIKVWESHGHFLWKKTTAPFTKYLTFFISDPSNAENLQMQLTICLRAILFVYICVQNML